MKIQGLNQSLNIVTTKRENNNFYNDIVLNDHVVGNIDFSVYHEDGEKYLGIGDFEIYPEYRNNGLGTEAIQYIVDEYSPYYDLIYCFVDKDNTRAIDLYSKVGNVYFDKVNDDNQYYVEFYSR